MHHTFICPNFYISFRGPMKFEAPGPISDAPYEMLNYMNESNFDQVKSSQSK